MKIKEKNITRTIKTTVAVIKVINLADNDKITEKTYLIPGHNLTQDYIKAFADYTEKGSPVVPLVVVSTAEKEELRAMPESVFIANSQPVEKETEGD